MSLHRKQYLKLQPLTEHQLTAVVELDQKCLGGMWKIDGYRREIHSPNSDLLIWKRETANQTQEQTGKFKISTIELDESEEPLPDVVGLGCSWAILEEAHITILAVHPNYQSQGLGQALLFALLVSAWERKLERATLEVRVSNQAAIKLYEKFGFQEAGRRKRYYQDTGEDALILWRSRLHNPEFEQTLTQWYQQICSRLQVDP